MFAVGPLGNVLALQVHTTAACAGAPAAASQLLPPGSTPALGPLWVTAPVWEWDLSGLSWWRRVTSPSGGMSDLSGEEWEWTGRSLIVEKPLGLLAGDT